MPATTAHPDVPASGAGSVAASRLERGATFALAAAAIVALALRGGSYDVVVRGEWGLGLWWLLALGLAIGVIPRERLGRPAVAGLAAFAALAGLTALALVWTESDERTVVELARVLMHAAVFALTACALRRATWPAAVAGLAAGAAIVAALAVGSRVAPGVFPVDAVRAGGFGGTRLNYPLNYWNAVGAWCAATVALCLAFSAHASTRAWRGAALAVLPIAVAGAYLTYSRAAAGGVLLAVAAVLVLGRHRWVALLHALVAAGASAVVLVVIRGERAVADGTSGQGGGTVVLVLAAAALVCAAVAAFTRPLDERLRLQPRPARALLAAGAVALLVAAAIAGPGLASRAWDEFTATSAAATSTDPAARLGNLSGNRHNVWGAALDIGAAHPGNGVGPGAFELAWNRDGRDPEHVRDAHSIWLEAWAELGIPGVIAVVALALALLAAPLAARARAAATGGPELAAAIAAGAALIVTGFHASFDWIWESTANASLAIALAGAATVGATTAQRAAAGAASRPRLAPRLLAAAVCVLCVLVSLPPTVGTSRLRASEAAAARGDDAAAVAAAADAVAIQPWAASPYDQRGLLHERAGALRAAEADLRRAQAREPTDWRHPLLLARVLAEEGRPRAAVRAFRRARALRPRSARLAARPAAP